MWQLREAKGPISQLLKTYSVDRVWTVGLETLGYPPSWELNVNEVLAIQAALQKG